MTENAYASGNQIKNIVKYMSDNCPDGGGGGSSEVIYSPEEQEVGKWQEIVDGVLKQKPIYQKTLFNTGTIMSARYDITSLGIEYVVKYDGTVSYDLDEGSTHEHFKLALPVVQSDGKFTIYVWCGSEFISVTSGTNRFSDLKITLYYTKTADTWEVV